MNTAQATGWRHSARRLLPLTWPVLVGQLSLLAYSTIDTVLVARHSPEDLAALAVGAAAYITVFIGLMGIVLALSPIVGQLHGAGRDAEAGRQAHQAVWLALFVAVPAAALLAFPAPFLAWAQAGPEVEAKVRGYLLALAVSVPASLLFTCYRAFNVAVSRPKAVMVLQLGSLGVKLPLSLLLVGGAPALGLPALGATGCGIATAVAMWAQLIVAAWWMRRDPFYTPFQLMGRGLDRPDGAALRAMVALGLPLGGAILIEVTGFSSMALFIARLGATPAAGHQLAVNLVSLLFMLPMALATGASTLVAQALGRGDGADARRVGWHAVGLAAAISGVLGAALYAARQPVLALYTDDAAVLAAALPLLAWVALFHLADAAQITCNFVLRAYKVATAPMVIYVASLWGVGIGGGYLLAFDRLGITPPALLGAPGFWFASTVGLVLAALALLVLLRWVARQRALEH